MRDYKWCRENFEAEDPFKCRTFQIVTYEGVAAFVSQRFGDFAQHLDKICAGAAAWVENVHVGVG